MDGPRIAWGSGRSAALDPGGLGQGRRRWVLNQLPATPTLLAGRPHCERPGFSQQTKNNEDDKSTVGLSPDVPHSASCAYLLLKQPRTSWVPPRRHPENPGRDRSGRGRGGAPGVTGGRLERGFGVAEAGQDAVQSWRQWTRCLRGPGTGGTAHTQRAFLRPPPPRPPRPEGGALQFRGCLSLKLSCSTWEDEGQPCPPFRSEKP